MKFWLRRKEVGDKWDNYPDVLCPTIFLNYHSNQKTALLKMSWNNGCSITAMPHGADFGDINNDGASEIFTTDMLPADDYRLKTTLSFDDIDQFRLKNAMVFHQFLQNTLQLNDGKGRFKDTVITAVLMHLNELWAFDVYLDNDGLSTVYI